MVGNFLLVIVLLGSLGGEVLGQQVAKEEGVPHKPDPCTPPTGSSETMCDQYCAEKDGGDYAGGCCMTEKDESGHSSPFNSQDNRNASSDYEDEGFDGEGVSAIPFCNCCERGYKCGTEAGSGCQCDDGKCAKYCSIARGETSDGCCSKDRKACECCNSDQICKTEGYPGKGHSGSCATRLT